jgi:hypothetical protein
LLGAKLDVKFSKLDRPLDNVAVGVTFADDLDLVNMEVVTKLSGRNQDA